MEQYLSDSIAWASLGYLLGSIPFGIVFAFAFGLGDLRSIGSGNIGATNVLRTGNKLAAFLTLMCDAGKAAAALLIAGLFVEGSLPLIAGAAAFLGHCFPIWLRFQGGKGVATFIGVFIAYDIRLGAMVCVMWLIGAAVSRRSSVGALTAAAATPVMLWIMGDLAAAVIAAGLAIILYLRHRENIKRFLQNTEPKIGRKS